MNTLTQSEQRAIKKALKILESHASYSKIFMNNPQSAKDYCKLKIGLEEKENFLVLFLTSRHELISSEVLFTGTIDAASVYPREVVKRALQHNAAAVILSHNHPSGVSEPSSADKIITDKLKQTLSIIDVRVLDHVVVGSECYSFAEHDLLS